MKVIGNGHKEKVPKSPFTTDPPEKSNESQKIYSTKAFECSSRSCNGECLLASINEGASKIVVGRSKSCKHLSISSDISGAPTTSGNEGRENDWEKNPALMVPISASPVALYILRRC